MLCKLLSANDGTYSAIVISLMDRGTLGDRIEQAGTPVYCLRLRRNSPDPSFLLRLRKLLHEATPDILQGWMYHGNFIALLASSLAPRRPALVWSIRQSLYGLQAEKPLTRLVIKAGARFSRRVDRIIYNSRLAAQQHEQLGYSSEPRIVIPNGFDCERFNPGNKEQNSVRRELSLPSDAILVGMVARFHPMKDHANFLHAAAIVSKLPNMIRFVMTGQGVDASNLALTRQIEELGLRSVVHLLGEREDMPEVMRTLDILVSASAWGEGFPNVVGEAMACEVPCIVTDIGDSSWIVGETGTVVPPAQPKAMAAAIRALIELDPSERTILGKIARQRVIENFSLHEIGKRYTNLYASLLGKDAHAV